MRSWKTRSIWGAGFFLFLGCSSSSTTEPHGPVYTTDAGHDAASNPSDATVTFGDDASIQGDDASSEDATTAEDGATAQDSSTPIDAAMTAPVDAGHDAAMATGPIDAGVDANGSDAPVCTSAIGILAGSSSTLTGATYRSNTWSVVTISNGSVNSVPSIVSESTGFHGALRSGSDQLQDVIFVAATSSWTAATQIAAATTNDHPALAVVGSALHVAYHGSDGQLYHGTYTSGAWDSASDRIGSVIGDASFFQDTSPGAPSAAGLTSSFVIAFDGSNGLLYDRTFTTMWLSADQPAGAAVYLPASGPSAAPALIALQGGTADLMAVFSHANDTDGGPSGEKITFTVRSAGTSTWSTPTIPDPNAFTTDPIALAPMSNGRAILVFRGTDSKPYFMVYDPSQSTPWTSATALYATGNPTLAGPPAVATGVCGADAQIIYAPMSGNVEVADFSGGSWSNTTGLAATSGLSYVAIATKP